jgi:hypothetical protein
MFSSWTSFEVHWCQIGACQAWKTRQTPSWTVVIQIWRDKGASNIQMMSRGNKELQLVFALKIKKGATCEKYLVLAWQLGTRYLISGTNPLRILRCWRCCSCLLVLQSQRERQFLVHEHKPKTIHPLKQHTLCKSWGHSCRSWRTSYFRWTSCTRHAIRRSNGRAHIK